MSATNAAEQALLDLIFLNVDWANIGDAGGLQNSATAGSFYISLHTADPGETGNQTTNEAAYTSYARVAVPRNGTGFSRSGSTISNADTVTFAKATGGSATCTHFGIGTDLSGTGNLLFIGTLNDALAVSLNIQPLFNAGELACTVD